VAAVDGEAQKIGIALSGGGSRAIAFHLGCLRTLDRLGILKKARVLSTVSGGSVIGAMYATHEGRFAEFEHRVRATLETGFIRPALRTAFTTPEGVKATASFLWLTLIGSCLTAFRSAAWIASWVIPGQQLDNVGAVFDRWVPRRFASRTTILRRTFDNLLFEGKTLGELRSDRPRLITVAAELRTGSAFYFSSNEAGSYRLGSVDPTRIHIAQAVTASAAYPFFLPALDELVTCRRPDGSLRTERVTLTDGGVYDNLGLAPLWPDRDPKMSIGVEAIDTIVACRAGYGRRMGNPSLFAVSRMKAAFACLFDRAQNHATKRLFDLKVAGRLKGFVLPYLDQDDRHLAYAPTDLVRRAAVADYPTNFSAMPVEWIERLSKRGEQLTLAVIREHAPQLLPPDWKDDSILVQTSRTTAAVTQP